MLLPDLLGSLLARIDFASHKDFSETVKFILLCIMSSCCVSILNLEQNTFKLTTPNGEELLFEAAGIQDRDRWAHAIGAVIRSITSSSQVSQLISLNSKMEIIYYDPFSFEIIHIVIIALGM